MQTCNPPCKCAVALVTYIARLARVQMVYFSVGRTLRRGRSRVLWSKPAHYWNSAKSNSNIYISLSLSLSLSLSIYIYIQGCCGTARTRGHASSRHGTARHGAAWHALGTALLWHGLARHAVARPATIATRHATAKHGTNCCGPAWQGTERIVVAQLLY